MGFENRGSFRAVWDKNSPANKRSQTVENGGRFINIIKYIPGQNRVYIKKRYLPDADQPYPNSSRGNYPGELTD
jgi:hypothetical protein